MRFGADRIAYSTSHKHHHTIRLTPQHPMTSKDTKINPNPKNSTKTLTTSYSLVLSLYYTFRWWFTQGQSIVLTTIFSVAHPENVTAPNKNDFKDNVIFAFGGTVTEVEVAFTGWGGTIATATIDAEQAGSDFGQALATKGDLDSGGEVAIEVSTCVNSTVIIVAVS